MSFIKNQLKVARSAINDKNYEYSAELCTQILENDPSNYNALVFLGLSLLELGEVEKSKLSYLKAIDISSDNLLAFNGLLKLYQQVNDVENQIKVLEQMGTIYGKSKDSGKYSENLDKLLQLSEHLEDKSTFKSFLRRYLPFSQYHDLIINCPSELSVWLKLHEISKQDAEIWVKNQVQSRKTRLGAGPLSQVQEKVEKEMIEMSDLGEIFTNLFKFELDFDSKFRIVDSAVNFWWMKLKYGEEKHYCLKTLSELIVKCRTEDIPCKAAWVLSFEFEDLQLESRSLNLIRNKQFLDEYNIFVESAYSLTEVDVDLNSLQAEILVALEQAPKSILGNQVLVQSLLMQEDWTNAKKSICALLETVSTFERETSLHYSMVLEDCHIKLAKCNLNSGDTIEALALYRTILQNNPKQLEALKGMGFAYLDIKQFKDAIVCFQTITELHPNDSAARADLGWALFLDGQAKTALPLLEAAHFENETYLSNYRMARLYWEMGDEYVLDKSYCHRHLVQSIKLNPHFSGSFTYLGHYYHFKENDDERASKCYSKAISINPTDSESIKMLIEIWLSSMRIGEAQKLLEEYSVNNPRSPYSWKQLGILSLHGGQYQTAINQLQSSLRIDAMDHVCWISLGEAYLNSGKYVASLKSLNRAMEINPKSTSALYLRGKVNQILARYDQGLADFLNVPKYRSNLIVNIALAELLLAYGIDLFGSGAFGAALDKFQEALEVGIELANSNNEKGFSLIGDILRKANDLFPSLLTDTFYDCVADVSKTLQQQFSAEFISFSQHISPVMATEKMGRLLLTASFAYSMAMHASIKTGNSRAPAYLGNISDCQFRIYLQSPNPLTLAASLRYCKSAIKFDSKNPGLWNLHGVITATTEPHISQHSFIKSCELDENVININGRMRNGGLI